MPQAAATQQKPAQQAAPADTPTDAPVTAATRQMDRARALERERAELQGRIAKNRDYLRLMEANDELTDDEKQWLNAFYPQKEKGERRSKDDIERTRKAKEEARKNQPSAATPAAA